MLPVVALIGRPNVGKSTLFNLLTRSRDAVTADLPGVTRDRHYGVCHGNERDFIVVDTGGLAGTGDTLTQHTERQVAQAVAEADLVVLLVDARDGLLPRDEDILKDLRRQGRSLLLVVNKVDGVDDNVAMAEFAALGLVDVLPVSATHNRGVRALLETLVPRLPPDTEPADDIDTGIRVAIVGRPNAGKSTLVNRLLGEDRVVVADEAGTTRDAIDVPLERDGRRYTLIDTAGIRRRARIEEDVEKVSVVKAMQSIAAARVALVLIDARENVAEQDLKLIGKVLEEGRALVVAVNKWDDLSTYQREQCQRELDRRLTFVRWARCIHISALHGSGVGAVMDAVAAAHDAAEREMTSASLTRTLEQACAQHQPPMVRGHTPKLRYAHPGGKHPPTVVIHGNRTGHIGAAYRRYLENVVRKQYRLQGTPVRIELRDGDNPWAGKRNELTERQRRKRQRLMRHSKKRRR